MSSSSYSAASSASTHFRGEPRRNAAQVPQTAEHWLRGNSGRTIYTTHNSQHNTRASHSVASSVSNKRPSPTTSAFRSENNGPGPIYARDFDWSSFKAQTHSRQPPVAPLEPFVESAGIPRPEKTPLGNSSNFPPSITGNVDIAALLDPNIDPALQCAFNFDYAGYHEARGFAFHDPEPTLNGNLEPMFMRLRTPEPAPYERSVEEEGLMKCVEPHWLTMKQPSQQQAKHADAFGAEQMSDEASMSVDSSYFDTSFDDSFGSISSVERRPDFGRSVSDDEGCTGCNGDAISSRSPSPASSIAESSSSEEEYLPMARNIRVAQASRRSPPKPKKRALPYPTARPRRNKQVDEDDFDFSDGLLDASHPSYSSSITLAGSSSSGRSSASSSKPSWTSLALEPNAISCPVCNFIPRGAEEDRSSSSKGLSSERRRTLKRHFDSHFESSRVVCHKRPNPDGKGTVGGCGKSLSRPDAMLRHLKTCPGPPTANRYA